jgi:hypothetical protein
MTMQKILVQEPFDICCRSYHGLGAWQWFYDHSHGHGLCLGLGLHLGPWSHMKLSKDKGKARQTIMKYTHDFHKTKQETRQGNRKTITRKHTKKNTQAKTRKRLETFINYDWLETFLFGL